MVNKGQEFHMFASAVVPHGLTSSGVLDSILHDRVPKNFKEWGGPNAVGPGRTGSVTLYFPPGDYVVGCFVTSPDGKTHFMKGMMGSFHVDAASDTGSAPVSDRRITLATYSIGMTDAPLAQGTRTFLVTNTAKETHDFVILKVLPGHTVAEALTWFRNPPTGTVAATVVGATTGIHTGEVAYVTADFTPGTYVLVCWMSTNGKYHYDLGMKKAFTVPAA